MPEMTRLGQPRASRRRRWLLIAGIVVGLLITVVVILVSRADSAVERRLRQVTIELLRERFDSEVELGDIDVQLQPDLRVRYERLVLRHRGRRDIPPIIAIRSFTLEGSLTELWNRRVDRVHIEGLEIVIPPGRRQDMPSAKKDDDASPREVAGETNGPDVLIKELVSENARLAIMPKQEGKRTREFLLHAIRLEQLQFTQPTPFQASLTNPVPEGRIETVGTFGPWEGDEPSLTPVTGSFTFGADLGTIRGIDGRLESEGSFSGPLERINASGRTHTPDFRVVALKGNAVPLSTTFDALIDGTNGDVLLNRVDAKIGESIFLNKGAVVGVKGVPGRHVTLDVNAKGARLADVLRLSLSGGESPMTGRLSIKAKLDLPPKGVDVDVVERMSLDGVFEIDDARFTSDEVQAKIDELARRGSGHPKDARIDNVMSDMKGRVKLAGGRMALSNLTFSVQGATIAMNGAYDLRSEALDFRGVVLLRARASNTMTGFRSLLLKPFDRLLSKQGAGTRLAIKVTGTRDHPQFGVDMGRTLKGR